MRVEALQKERNRAVIMKLRLPGPFIARENAEFPVYDLQMQQSGRPWRSLYFFLFYFFLIFFRTPNMFRTVGREWDKKQITNCHFIWQLECRFNVWGRRHLSAKRLSFSSRIMVSLQSNVIVLLEQLIGWKVSMLLGTWIGFLWGPQISECVSV